jgi:iron(III) transport system ATP-binding protein
MHARVEPAATSVRVDGLHFRYQSTVVLDGIDVSLAQGRTLALLGPSGCGKTTLLRLVAGLLAPSAGAVSISGRIVADGTVFVPPERRDLGMVFQDYALWPHLSVAGNVAFPLEMRRVGRAERDRRVVEALARVGLADFAERSPGALSGGQQQRVAIARAIVAEPAIVLFDEPLSNLDRELRETMVTELAGLIAGLGLTAIYVTHDHAEAFTLADEVAVMRAGRIVQLGAPEALINSPADPGVADFLRLGTVLTVTRGPEGLSVAGVTLQLATAPEGEKLRALFPPRAFALRAPEAAPLTGHVTSIHFRGDGYTAGVAVEAPEGRIDLQVSTNIRPRAGERVGIALVPEQLRWFPAEP